MIDFDNNNDKSFYNQLLELVKKMLILNNKMNGDIISDEKTRLERQIEAIDRQIDMIIFQLYDLTPEEIKLINSGE